LAAIDFGQVTGREMIEFERVTELTFSEVAHQAEEQKLSAAATLGLAYLMRRRDHPDTVWDEFIDEGIDDSLALLAAADDDTDEDGEGSPN